MTCSHRSLSARFVVRGMLRWLSTIIEKRVPGNSASDSSHFLIDAGIENGNVPFPLLGNSHADKEQLYVR